MKRTYKPYTPGLAEIQHALVDAGFSSLEARRAVSDQFIGIKYGGKFKWMSRHFLDAEGNTLAKQSLRSKDRDEAQDQIIQDEINAQFYAAIRAHRIKTETKKPRKGKR